MKTLIDKIKEGEKLLQQGGGEAGLERQKRLQRMSARERVAALIDKKSTFLELGLWAAYEMYQEWGGLPAAGAITGIGTVQGRSCMIIANDATVKAGAMFPQSVKKVLRAQRIAYQCRLPILYLVDSSGVFLPLQDEIFPDEDDFGRIFRNNSVLSACGIPQFAAIMGNCIAGGGYLPVLCDKLLMTKGSGLYLAGPALVKAAIGQVIDTEELGGAEMHASISGTVDFLEENDIACLERLRSLVDLLPSEESSAIKNKPQPEIYKIVSADNSKPYDIHSLLDILVDKGSLQEYKREYGKSLVTAFATIEGEKVGILANQRIPVKTGRGEIEIGGVIYAESADKAARFVMDCNQMKLPLLFLQDVVGFMVGREAEQSGIIRSGAKLVNAISNSIVPKITVIIGNSFGAGNYALCGKAYDPAFVFAWPNAKYAVMGAEQASDTLLDIKVKTAERNGKPLTEAERKALKDDIVGRYQTQTDIRYAAARGWIDAIIDPAETRTIIGQALRLVKRAPLPEKASFHTGVIQV
ncbi:MAG: acyl-CoA carboxylase subunit beta [Parachlamydiales bacterium]